jgi:hypothetical protein
MFTFFTKEFSPVITHENGLSVTEYSDGTINLKITEKAVDEISTDTYQDVRFYNYLFGKHIEEKFIVLVLDEEKDTVNKFFDRSNLFLLSPSDLKNKIPTTINDLLIHLMEVLAGSVESFGQDISTLNKQLLLMRNNDEISFFMKHAKEIGLIDYIDTSIRSDASFSNINILPKGWEFINNIEIGNQKKNQVFIAMWFDSSMDTAGQEIQKAVGDLGFIPMRIDQKEHNNEISGEILYEIRKSKCVIADVTGQRPGVYFEAGYALGRNIPVIWSCRVNEIEKVHFDTRQYNHIVWNDSTELYQRIKNRIKATIM